MVSNEKKIHRAMTRAVAEKYNPIEIVALAEAFNILMQAFPQEGHFIIGFAYAGDGQGEKVWLIIDESATQLMETMMFPVDY